MMKKIYPRTGDTQTVYLNAVVKDPSIEVGDYTIEIPVQLCQPYFEILIHLHFSAFL